MSLTMVSEFCQEITSRVVMDTNAIDGLGRED